MVDDVIDETPTLDLEGSLLLEEVKVNLIVPLEMFNAIVHLAQFLRESSYIKTSRLRVTSRRVGEYQRLRSTNFKLANTS